MTVTFTPEDGTGLVGANSYVTLAEIKDYLSIIPGEAELTPLDDDTLQNYAMWSTRIIDQKVKWKGCRETWPDGHIQGLQWPRVAVADKYGQLIPSDIVPSQVKAATIEFMRYIKDTDPTTGQDVTNLKEVDVDVIKVIYQDGVAQTSYPSLINQLLEGLGFMKIGTAGFGRVIKA